MQLRYRLLNENEIRILNENEIENDSEKEITNNYEKKDKYIEFILQKGYIILVFVFQTTCKVVKYIISFSGIYLLWIILHYFASHLYIRFCVPQTIIGFLISPFLTATPHCQGLRWVVYNGGNFINNMWVVLGTWICSNILIMNKELPANTVQ